MSNLIRPNHDQAVAGLRAILTVVTAGGPLDDERRGVLEAAQRHVLRSNHDLDGLAPIEPEALAAIIPEPALREQISRAICLYVMFPDSPPRAEIDAAERFVRVLGGPDDALERTRSIYESRMITLRFDAMRSSFMGDSMRRQLHDEGVLGVLSSVGEILGIRENAVVADRYRALAGYPDGSLGRALHAFYTERGFLFPGERGGAPESIVAHDLSHVLAGYSTDLPSEACVTAFQAGYRREDPFSGLLFVMLNMQKGISMTKLAPAATHMLAQPGMADRVVAAWSRGTKVTIDLVKDWDYWKDMERPLVEVRAEYNISP